MKPWLKAMGLASSLGPLIPACASFRAGMHRSASAPEGEPAFPGAGTPGAGTARALGAARDGVGRLSALLTGALEDLASREDLTLLGRHAGLYVALPDPRARGFASGGEDAEALPEEPARRAAMLAARVVPPALEASGLRGWTGRIRPHFGDHAAFARALAQAVEDLRAGVVRSALVCAVDSVRAPPTRDALSHGERPEAATHASDIAPGEAGVALLLLPRLSGTPPGPELPVFLRGVSVGEDAASPTHGGAGPSDGRVLAECARAALGKLEPNARPPVLVSDHDGQPHRAHEWRMLQLHLAASNHRLAACPAWLPAAGFGSTGAASGGIGVATALHALQRGYAPSTSALVLSSSDSGARAAIHLSTR